MPTAPIHVRLRWKTGKHLRRLSISHFDPTQTLRLTLVRCALVRMIGRDCVTTPKVQPLRVRWQSGQRPRMASAGTALATAILGPSVIGHIGYRNIFKVWASEFRSFFPRDFTPVPAASFPECGGQFS
jgi:hypothetical protein